MVDLKCLESAGYSEDSLRKKLTGPVKAGSIDKMTGEPINDLRYLLSSRIREGINRSLMNSKFYWAVDEAFTVAQRQISPTLVRGLLTNQMSSDQIYNAAQSWGLTDMMSRAVDPKTNKPLKQKDGKPVMQLDLPTFTQVFVPLVVSYLKMRWAKLWDDRDLVPLYKYEPSVQTMANRLRCDIVTQSVDRFVDQVGVRAVERQSILQMLMYGTCLNFAIEPWYKEEQARMREGGKKTEVSKQGVRFSVPHPTRTFYDLSNPLTSINSDSGVEYAGYWDVYRWHQIAKNKKFWLDGDDRTFSVGPTNQRWLKRDAWDIYRSLYPCVISFPTCTDWSSRSLDRTNEAFTYTLGTPDTGVSLATTYMKLVPKDWDLFDYDHPVWFRFVNILEESIIYAEPICYCPVTAYQYDADQNNYRPTSLAYELIPWQDHLGNLLSQYILSVKRNLTNAVLYNKDGVDPSVVERLENIGKKIYTDINFIPTSKKELQWSGIQGTKELFDTVNFPMANTGEIMTGINTLVNIMERVLGFSAAEVGQPAAHEQSATEVATITQNVGIRLDLTGSFVDDAIAARKRLLYEAMMAYADDDVVGQVGLQNDATLAQLEMIGFSVEVDPDNRTAGVSGKKSLLDITSFEAGKPTGDRTPDSKIAVGMMQLMSSVFSPPVLQAVGTGPLIEYLNQIMKFVGVPKELRLEPPANGAGPQQQGEQLMQQVMQMIKASSEQQMQAIAELIQQKVVIPQAKINQQHGQQISQIAQGLAQINEAVQQLMTPQEMPVPGQPQGLVVPA